MELRSFPIFYPVYSSPFGIFDIYLVYTAKLPDSEFPLHCSSRNCPGRKPYPGAYFICLPFLKDSNLMGFSGSSAVKNLLAMRRHRRRGFSPWVGKTPWRRKWQATPGFLPGESRGQRSVAGHSPQGCKESASTEGLSSRSITPLESTLLVYCCFARHPKC